MPRKFLVGVGGFFYVAFLLVAGAVMGGGGDGTLFPIAVAASPFSLGLLLVDGSSFANSGFLFLGCLGVLVLLWVAVFLIADSSIQSKRFWVGGFLAAYYTGAIGCMLSERFGGEEITEFLGVMLRAPHSPAPLALLIVSVPVVFLAGQIWLWLTLFQTPDERW